MKAMAILGLVNLIVCAGAPAESRKDDPIPEFVREDWLRQYREHYGTTDKTGRVRMHRARNLPQAAQALRPPDEQALIWETDRDPTDAALRRTEALLERLAAMPFAPERIRCFRERLAEVRAQVQATQPDLQGKEPLRIGAYLAVCALRREMALANPLLAFDELLVIERPADSFAAFHLRPGPDKQHWWQRVPEGGGLYVVSGLSQNRPRAKALSAQAIVENGCLKGGTLHGGIFRSADLSFDGSTVFLSWAPAKDTPGWPGRLFHVFSMRRDGTGLRQLTFGESSNWDPTELPDGRIAFTSTRRNTRDRCPGLMAIACTLHSMKADGSDLIPISFHETHEWSPSVAHDGRLIYTRWDYVDRGVEVAHNLWTCYPDGRDPRAPHGNYAYPMHGVLGKAFGGPAEPDQKDVSALRPAAEHHIRAIPGSPRFSCVGGTHHSDEGPILVIDTSCPDDYLGSQLRAVTPYGRFGRGGYRTVWPLSEDFYLAHRGSGICLIDRFGNEELLVASPLGGRTGTAWTLIGPVPLRVRPRPPVIPPATWSGERAALPHKPATVSVMNVYDADFAWPEGRTPRWLRVIRLVPHGPGPGEALMHGQSLSRIPLGLAPIEADGSVSFQAPVGCPLYFQVLDEEGLAIQSMRSLTYVQRGEHLSCQGCHEHKHRAPSPLSPESVPLAMQRTPSRLEPELPEGVVPAGFYHLVKHSTVGKTCVACHAEQGKGPPSIEYEQLAGAYPKGDGYGQWLRHERWIFQMWVMPYNTDNVFGYRSTPGRLGASASRLWRHVMRPEAKKRFGAEDLRRLSLWLDCNSNEFGAGHSFEEQRAGKVVWPKHMDPAKVLEE